MKESTSYASVKGNAVPIFIRYDCKNYSHDTLPTGLYSPIPSL
jgi:hypothetical protein